MAAPDVPTTDAERALAALFETRAPGFGSAPLDATRADAFARFAEAGLPHRRVEAYRYTDLKRRLRTLPPAAAEAADADVAAALDANPPLADGSARVVIANGRFIPARSAVPQGMRVASLLSPDAETERVGSLVAGTDDPLTLANIALFDGGVVLHVDGKVETPVEIVHIITADALVMARAAVVVAPGAEASIVERTIGGGGVVTNSLAEFFVAGGARLSVVRIADGLAEETTLLSTHHAELGESAVLEHLSVATGKGLSRAQTFCRIVGDDADANFRAATVALDGRHADNTLVMHHDALGSRSSEVFRSAVGTGGIAIVQGRIIVDPGAQKTDAKMMSNALFLDDTGEVVNKPELEIFADDVICGHGATSGDIDEDPVFYLRARGIPEATARRLLTEAFIIEALDLVADEALNDALAERIRTALAAVVA